jgi:uncharacterized membrane protein YeaQ/YmgE (transglycosylase-associated protein family)
MSLLLLVLALVGLLVGAAARRLIRSAGTRSTSLNMLIGVAGALVGGLAATSAGVYGLVSLAAGLLGACLALFGVGFLGRTKGHRDVALNPNGVANTVAPLAKMTTPDAVPPEDLRTVTHEHLAAQPERAASAHQRDATPAPGRISNQGHIFLSYATPDREAARALAIALSERGFNVWWDRTIPPGKRFDEVIEQALDSARCVVVLWTKSSTSSNWVRAEAAEGLRRQILVPVLIEDVRIPLEFRRIQAANLADWKPSADHAGFSSLLSSVVSVVGSPREDSGS